MCGIPIIGIKSSVTGLTDHISCTGPCMAVCNYDASLIVLRTKMIDVVTYGVFLHTINLPPIELHIAQYNQHADVTT